MKISQIQIRLVRRCFSLASTNTPQIAALFYDRLFELDPTIRRLFENTDMNEQRKKVMHMLAFIVNTLDDPVTFQSTMQALGKRHLDYGVQKDHYDLFNTALLWALEKSLDSKFTPAMREAWRTTLQLMKEAATNDLYDAPA